MRALLATNFKEAETRDKILPALSKHVDVVGVVAAEHSTDFRVSIDRLKPDVVLLMNEVVSHSTSWRLADVCRIRNVKLAVLGQQKSGWPAVLARLAPPSEGTGFARELQRARVEQGYSHHDIATRVGVSKATVKAWEAGEGRPSTVELKRLKGVLRRLNVRIDPVISYEPDPSGEAVLRERFVAEVVVEPEVETEPKTFAEALLRARLREGMTQEELGEVFNVTRQAVCAWELGTATPVRSHYDGLLDLLPELAVAPEPPVQDIDKPNGGADVERASQRLPSLANISANILKEEQQNMAQNSPTTMSTAFNTDTHRRLLASEARVTELEANVAELEADLEKAKADSVSGAAEALKRLVRAGFFTEAEAAARWTARIQ